ncbi:hypothetical protein [Fundidesulfovibrio putealis]|uniref:hypothetical protein n=1 Tax=Fundidesulfovibrio putealis TaxID=270496 RepID=UPI0004851F82|nr:hypothetical protein [Fundidesulfovibrio putealis]
MHILPSSGRVPQVRTSQAFWLLLIGCAATLLTALVAKGLTQRLIYEWYTLAHPYFVNPMEGREAVKAWMLGNAASIYPVQPGTSFIVTIYPPLYHLLTLVTAHATDDFLLAGRLVSLASTGVVAGLIMAWTNHSTGNRLIAAITGLSFLADAFTTWGAQARPDMTAHALALGGAYLFLRAQTPRESFWAALLAAMALFTKQQTLPFILGTLLYGLLKGPKERRNLITYLWALAVFTVVPGFVLNEMTHGQFFTDIVEYPARMGEVPGIFTMENLLGRARTLWEVTAWKTALTGGWAIACLLSLRLDFALLLLLLNLPFVLRLLGTWGADYNYALGLIILMYPCLGMLAGRFVRLPKAGSFAAAVLFILVNLDGGHTFSRAILDNPHLGKFSGVREGLMERLRRTPGPILVNTEGGQLFLGQGLESKLVFFDAIELGLFEKAGFWAFSDSSLARNIAGREYAIIVLSNNFIPQNMTWLMSGYYASQGVMGQYELYAPRPEDSIVPISSLSLPIQVGDVSMKLLAEENIRVAEDHIEPHDQALPANLTVEVETRSSIKELELSLFPRLNHSDGSSLSITVSSGAEGLERTWICPTLPGREWSGIWEMHASEHFATRGDRIRITFHLKGNSQLYFNKSRPMMIYLTGK